MKNLKREDILLDLYERLTSRKFLSFLVATAFLVWNFMEARLDALQFQVLFWAQATTYGLVEGAGDFAANWHSTPSTSVRTTVNAGTDGPPEVKRETEAKPSARPKRVRKPKAPVVVVGGKG